MKALFLAILLIFSSVPAFAERFDTEGYVVRIAPDNAIVVCKDSSASREDAVYRLWGIGMPGQNKPFGQQAHAFLTQTLPKGTLITVKVIDTKKSEAIPEVLVQVYGKSLNYAMIREGLAWVDRQHCTSLYCRRWHIEEHRAVTEGRGIWGLNMTTPPWQWGQ